MQSILRKMLCMTAQTPFVDFINSFIVILSRAKDLTRRHRLNCCNQSNVRRAFALLRMTVTDARR